MVAFCRWTLLHILMDWAILRQQVWKTSLLETHVPGRIDVPVSNFCVFRLTAQQRLINRLVHRSEVVLYLRQFLTRASEREVH